MIIVDLYLDLVSLIIGCLVVRRSWPFAFRCLFLVNILKVFNSYASFIWSTTTHTSNHWMLNLFFPLQCAGLLLVFYKSSIHPVVIRIDGWLLAVLPVVIGVSWARGAPLDIINIGATVACDFLLLLVACAALIDQLLRTDDVRFTRQPLFWLASGLFFYSVGFIIFFTTFEYSKKMIMWGLFKSIYFFSGYLLNVGIIGCFICLYLKKISKEPETDLRQPV